jgi:hypothetical protein
MTEDNPGQEPRYYGSHPGDCASEEKFTTKYQESKAQEDDCSAKPFLCHHTQSIMRIRISGP